MASTEGGVEIEDGGPQHPEKIIKVTIDPLLGLQAVSRRVTVALRLGLEFRQADSSEIRQADDRGYKLFVELRSAP